MARVRFFLFLVGVLIVLVGLSLLIAGRVELIRRAGETISGPPAWATLITSIADLWSRVVGGTEQVYRTGLIVLAIGVVVMAVPIAPPPTRRR